MKADAALQGYFAEAAAWDADRVAQQRRVVKLSFWVAGAGWLCDGLSELAEQRSGAGSGRLRPKSDVSEAPYPGPSCRTCPA